MELAYRSFVLVEDLRPGECTIHRASDASGKRWWLLWFHVYREDRAGERIDLAVPVNPNGSYLEQGPGGRTWGLMPAGNGRWQVAPSIDSKDGSTVFSVPGFHDHPARSVWHQTPVLVAVADGEPWQTQSP
jgi:hypothetical protein